MQAQYLQFRYRSIKYSTSSLSLAKTRIENTQPPSKLHIASSTPSTPNLFVRQVSKPIPFNPVQENRWSPVHTPSSHYKLRLVAKSSHLRTRCSEVEEQPLVQNKEEEQECVILPAGNHCPPFQAYFNLLQESLDALHPQLEDQRIETQRIQQGMIEIRRQAETQLRQVESEMQSKLEKLRNQLRLAFKEHSKQIINTRESVSQLRMDLQGLTSLSEQVREGAKELQQRFGDSR